MFVQWILLLLYVVLGAANIVRGVLGLIVDPVLTSMAGLLTLFSGIYLVWGLAFLAIAAIYLASSKRFSPKFVIGSAVLYEVTMWLIRLLGDHSSYARRLWPRDAVLAGVFVAFVILMSWAVTTWQSRHGIAHQDDVDGG